MSLFSKKYLEELSSEEKQFLENISQPLDATPNSTIYLQREQALVTFKLAKAIEESTKANDKASKRMFWLTIALFVAAALQAIAILIK